MSLLNQAAAAAEITDQTQAPASYEYEVPPAGFTTARFIGYVEVGKQPQRAYEGVEKPDAATVRLTFELNGPKHVTEYEHDGEKKTRTNIIRQTLTISTHEKANFAKLLKKMSGGRDDVKHMAQMLGEGFLIQITHSKSKDGKTTYANMKQDGAWNIGAPSVTDPVTNEVRVLTVPEATQPIQLLLWDNPSEEQWNSIFIDGEYEKEIDGKKVVVSKNFIQEQAQTASNFEGSALETLLSGIGDVVADIAEVPEEKPAPKKAKKAAKKAEPEAPAETDPLADLGLV